LGALEYCAKNYLKDLNPISYRVWKLGDWEFNFFKADIKPSEALPKGYSVAWFNATFYF
jgi:hypothetical protein